MPSWTTPRRLAAAVVLCAVFASGWFLGQPVYVPECTIGPHRYSDHLEAENCDTRPRLLAWLNGDWS
ncbi:hypothetical protein [Streptomyces halobius]|uniref:Alpha amylase inhibitor n=1 Tax=Streptomyces halobius TaxID=2879846 RepID=A0ABY4MPE4_9ACTN|nr:hypothetical protein [Streptomyces halobius]UQA98191.1 hypothetical protein K9S39_12580 [Streptomyces halobius]